MSPRGARARLGRGDAVPDHQPPDLRERVLRRRRARARAPRPLGRPRDRVAPLGAASCAATGVDAHAVSDVIAELAAPVDIERQVRRIEAGYPIPHLRDVYRNDRPAPGRPEEWCVRRTVDALPGPGADLRRDRARRRAARGRERDDPDRRAPGRATRTRSRRSSSSTRSSRTRCASTSTRCDAKIAPLEELRELTPEERGRSRRSARRSRRRRRRSASSGASRSRPAARRSSPGTSSASWATTARTTTSTPGGCCTRTPRSGCGRGRRGPSTTSSTRSGRLSTSRSTSPTTTRSSASSRTAPTRPRSSSRSRTRCRRATTSC